MAREEDFFRSWQGQERARLVPPPLFPFSDSWTAILLSAASQD